MIANNELVYVLHTRKYRETSQLVDFLSREAGRLRVVARGTRPSARVKKTATGPVLNPFQPFFASWRGRSDLKTLTGFEPAATVKMPQGEALYVGFYVNELLTRLLPEFIPNHDLFDHYAQLITILSHGVDMEPELRCFELRLLSELGHGINFCTNLEDGSAIIDELDYRYEPGEGFSRVSDHARRDIFAGSHLRAIEARQFDSVPVRQSAKRLIRSALALHLGNKPLHSRELYQQSRSSPGNAQ